MSRVFKGLRAIRAPGLAIASNASMRGLGTKMGTVTHASKVGLIGVDITDAENIETNSCRNVGEALPRKRH
jgi:hypothetical protein